MTTPHHSEPAREAVALPSEITEAQINSACLSYRHDFGLLDEHDRERLSFVAKEWLHAWRKEFEPLAPALRVSAAPAPAASGGLEAVRDWPPLKKALWDVVTEAELNAPRYVNAYEFTDKLYAAALAAPAATGGDVPPLVAWLSREADLCAAEEDIWREGMFRDAAAALSQLAHPAPSETGASYQTRLATACDVLFAGDPTDVAERRDRFAEEANEVCQAFGMTREEAHQLVDYTYSRPVGEPSKEIGAAMTTLASLAREAGHDLMACAEADLAKLEQPDTIARIRAKRATRHGRGPLPGLSPAALEGRSDG